MIKFPQAEVVKNGGSLERYVQRRFVRSGTSSVKDLYPYCKPMEALGVGNKTIDEPSRISFAHYDYLGLADDVRIKEAAHKAIDDIGIGAGASRLVGGEHAIHRELERCLADFIGVEDSLTLVSGYGTNVTLISHMMTRGDLILVDESAHNSIMAGTQLARAEVATFNHNDLDHLREQLANHRSDHKRILVVVEGLYSMDGDVPDLPRLLSICRHYDAWLMIDEAHSIGVLGARGRGITEHFGISPSEIDLIVGTLSKAFGSCGGFIAGKKNVIDWLRYTLPGFVYSVGLPPSTAAAALLAVGILEAEPERLEKLRQNSEYFLKVAQAAQLETGSAIGSAVAPVHFPDVRTALCAGNAAFNAGFYVPPIVQIAVPKELPRLRFFLTARHTRQQIDDVLGVLSAHAKNLADSKPHHSDQAAPVIASKM